MESEKKLHNTQQCPFPFPFLIFVFLCALSYWKVKFTCTICFFFCTAFSILLIEWIITVEYVEEIVESVKKYNIHIFIFFKSI